MHTFSANFTDNQYFIRQIDAFMYLAQLLIINHRNLLFQMRNVFANRAKGIAKLHNTNEVPQLKF